MSEETNKFFDYPQRLYHGDQFRCARLVVEFKTETEKIEFIITPGKYQRELSGDIFGRVTFGAKYLSK